MASIFESKEAIQVSTVSLSTSSSEGILLVEDGFCHKRVLSPRGVQPEQLFPSKLQWEHMWLGVGKIKVSL